MSFRGISMLVRTAAAVAAILIAAAAAHPLQDPPASKTAEDKDPFRVHIRMHRKVAPKVVQVRSEGQSGSGVIIRSDGLIITSPTACGPRSLRANVILPGPRRVEARVVGRCNDLELALLKIDAKDLPVMDFADSKKARVGQVAYAFGDVWDSIGTDDQVAMSLGIVSGLYEITATQNNTLYTGPVIETSAAVNQNLDGGPLVDSEGRMLGMITLNYHPAKFTGIAVPAHILKPEVERLIREFTEGAVPVADGFVGIIVSETPGETGVMITHIEPGSPAEKQGLKVGDQILRIDSDRVTTFERFERLTQDIRASSKIRFQVRREGKDLNVTVTAGLKSKPPSKPEY